MRPRREVCEETIVEFSQTVQGDKYFGTAPNFRRTLERYLKELKQAIENK